MEKENQRVRLTKLLLKDKLRALLSEKPINRITVKEICAAAGINRSTFYQHYPDQYALLEDLEEDVIRAADEFVAKIDPHSDGRQALLEFMSYIRANGTILAVLLDPRSGTTFQMKFVAYSLGRLAVTAPEIVGSPLEPYFTRYIVMGDISLIQQWIKNGYDIPEETVADMIYYLSDNAVDILGGMMKKQKK